MAAEPVAEQSGPSGVVEIACDESGFSGSNLLDEDTRVFAHASVRVGPEEARRAVERIRAASPYSLGEYKAAQLLRPTQRPVLTWLLGPEGPLYGRAAVQLTDKPSLLAGRLSGLFAGELDYATGTSLDRDDRVIAFADVLYHQGPATFGPAAWRSLLAAFSSLLRSKNPGQFAERTETFLAVAATLRAEPGLPVAEPLALIQAGRPALVALGERLFDDRTLIPPLEVLIPALLETAVHWSADGDEVRVVHDEQSALTVHRVGQLNRLLRSVSDSRLVLEQADSRANLRVQLADLLAGAARQIASRELAGRGDRRLTELLRPYLGPAPIWADTASWLRLAG